MNSPITQKQFSDVSVRDIEAYAELAKNKYVVGGLIATAIITAIAVVGAEMFQTNTPPARPTNSKSAAAIYQNACPKS